MLPYLKPYRDIPSSLTLLGLRGMEFTDPEFAQKRLSRIGYYRLSAYWYPFRRFWAAPSDPGKPAKTQERIRCDRFEDGTEFDHMRRSNGSLNDLHTTRLYGALVAIVFLMRILHPRTRWHLRLAKFVLTSGLPQELSSKSAGFPERWQDQEIWQELVL